MKKTYSEAEVKFLLKVQRHNCQIERDKRSLHNQNGFYVHCEDVMNAEEPDISDEHTFRNFGVEKIHECYSYAESESVWVGINAALLALDQAEVRPGQVLDLIQEFLTIRQK